MAARVTVAVPTFNGEEFLDALLSACRAQETANDVEVLVIDSGSTDSTLDIVRSHPGVRLHQIPNREFGHGRTRNLAVQLATGDVVAFLTQDAVPEEGWLSALVAPFADPSVGAVVGRQRPRPECCPPIRRDVAAAFDALSNADGAVRLGGQAFLSNVNAAYRRDVLGHTPFRDVDYAEDLAIAADLAAAGINATYAPDAVVEHSHDLGLGDYYRRMQAEATGVAAVRAITGDRRRPSLVRLIGAVVVGTLRDWRFVLSDRGLGLVGKLRWLAMAPLYNLARRVAILTAPPPHARRHTLADDARAATRGGASLLAGQFVSRLLAIGFVLITTHRLAPSQFGRYSTVAALVIFGNFLADFGTGPAITRLSARDPSAADRYMAGTLIASVILGLAAYGGIIGFAALTYPSRLVADVALGAIGVPFASVLSSVLGVLDGVGQLGRRAFVGTMQSLIVSAGAIPVLLGHGVRGALVALAIAPIAALFVASAIAWRSGVWRSMPHWDREVTGRLFRTALPFALSGGLTALTMKFDVVLLSILKTPAETAVYDLALRLLEASTVISAAICGPLLFIISRRLGAGDHDGAERAYREALRALYLIGLPLSLCVVALARPAVSTFLGPRFSGVAWPLEIMGGAQWLTFIIYVQGALVMGGDAVGRGVAVGVLNTLVTVVLDIALVPAFGATGAASAMVASWVFAVVALHRHHVRSVSIATPAPSLRMLAALAAMAAVMIPLLHVSAVAAFLGGVMAYGGVLIASGEVGRSDVHRMTTALRGP